MDEKGGMAPRVCVIGAGQSGMAQLYNFARLGDSSPEVVCYEKGATWGGQWNCTWRTDTDEHGERINSGMYRTMWINGPKETLEIPHYTYDKHFEKTTPSFFPAPMMRSYLDGYWRSSDVDLSKMIRFNTIVHNVKYNDDEDNFTVITRDLLSRTTNSPETFSHVIVASGNYTYPNAPEFKGFDTFPGRIMHSQQFRGGKDFKGKRILVIGSSLSAEDIAGESYKHGAIHVIITWRRCKMALNFPEGVEERPLIEEMNGNVAKFKDGSTAEIDVIVYCTGYNMSLPFLEDSLQLSEKRTSFFPTNLYKSLLWLGGGNKKLLYVCPQMIRVPLVLAELQAVWIVRYITGINPIHPEDRITPGWNVDAATLKAYQDKMESRCSSITDFPSIIAFGRELVRDLNDDVGHNFKPDEMMDMFLKRWEDQKVNFVGFRNHQYKSTITGVTAPPPETKWIDAP